MQIFRAFGADGHELIHPVGGWDLPTALLNGTSRKSSWTPLRVKVVKAESDGTPFARSDCPSFCVSYALVFREDAMLKLGAFLAKTGETLPLTSDEGPLFIWHPLTVVPAVDLKASIVWRFKDGRLMDIRRYVFIPERVRGLDAFKISELKVSPIFFSKRAVDILSSVLGHHLDFKLVWSDEESSVSPQPAQDSR
jgi:hypothetical protein